VSHFLSNNISVIPRTECKFVWVVENTYRGTAYSWLHRNIPTFVQGDFSSGLFQGCMWKNWNHNPRASATLSIKQATYESYYFTRSTSAWQGT